jgi:phage-related protein (TIGR01555 family)
MTIKKIKVTTLDSEYTKEKEQKALEKSKKQLEDSQKSIEKFFSKALPYESDGIDSIVESINDIQEYKTVASLKETLNYASESQQTTIENKIHKTMDSIKNKALGYGTQGVDGTVNSYYVPRILSYQTLQTLYQTVALVNIIIDKPIDDAFRAGFTIETKDLDKEEIATIIETMDNMALNKWLGIALKWQRVFGGSGLMLLTDNDNITKELSEEEKIIGLRPIDRFNLFPYFSNRIDPTKDNYFQVDYYLCLGKKIHPSRIFAFKDDTVPFNLKQEFLGWGNSILNILYEPLLSVSLIQKALVTGASKGNFVVYKSNLVSDISNANPDAQENFHNALKMINLNASTNKFIAVPSDDDMEVKNYTFTELTNLMESQLNYLASASKITKSILLSEGHSGLNNDNATVSLPEYYNMVNAIQERDIVPVDKFFIQRIAKQKLKKDIPLNKINIVFNSMFAKTRAEENLEKQSAVEQTQILMNLGVFDKSMALQELSPYYTSITQEVIEKAKEEEANEDSILEQTYKAGLNLKNDN